MVVNFVFDQIFSCWRLENQLNERKSLCEMYFVLRGFHLILQMTQSNGTLNYFSLF